QKARKSIQEILSVSSNAFADRCKRIALTRRSRSRPLPIGRQSGEVRPRQFEAVVAANSEANLPTCAASKIGSEHVFSVQTKAAALASCGYSTSELGNGPSLRSHHSMRRLMTG